MISITEGTSYTREVCKIIWGNKLQVSAAELDNLNAYAVDDFLHENLITFPNIFLNKERGIAAIKRVHVKIYGNPLWKPNLRLALFNKNECDIAPVMNAKFNWGTVCKGEHVLNYTDILGAEFIDQSHDAGAGALTYYSRYISQNFDMILDNENLDPAIAQSNDLVGLLICKTIGQFSTGAWLKVGLEIRML